MVWENQDFIIICCGEHLYMVWWYRFCAMVWRTFLYGVDNMCIYRGDYGVMLWVYAVEYIYPVGYHMVWTTVLHTIYDLLSTPYICCGGMVWVQMSSSDEV